MNTCNITLFCLPFSGGNIYSYRTLETYLADFIKPVPLELPGHGRRLKEPLLTDIHEIIDDIFRQINVSLTSPYAIYGHSMGTITGYLLTHKILKEQMSPPLHLFFSGHGAPALTFQEEPIHLLPNDRFVQKVLEYGGIPEEVATEKALMDLFGPIMKADFQSLYEYTYQKAELLDIPITVIIGMAEGIADEDILAWQEVTTRDITIKKFSGGHFFIFDHLRKIGHLMSQTLQRVI